MTWNNSPSCHRLPFLKARRITLGSAQVKARRARATPARWRLGELGDLTASRWSLLIAITLAAICRQHAIARFPGQLADVSMMAFEPGFLG